MPLLYRDAPLNSIWEGSGNVLRSMSCARWSRSPTGCRRSSRNASWPRAPTAASTRTSPAAGAHARRVRGRRARVRRAPRRRGPGPRAPGIAARALRAAGRRGRVLRGAARAVRAGASTGRFPRASTRRRSSTVRCRHEHGRADPRAAAPGGTGADRGGRLRTASVIAIAERAGVAAGTLYRHFSSKEELFVEVFRLVGDRELQAIRGGGGRRPARRGSTGSRPCSRRSPSGRCAIRGSPGH